MKKHLLTAFYLVFILCGNLLAQTTGPYIVTNNVNRMNSCEDSLITLEDIYLRTGITDLNDPADHAGNYRMLALNGSVITETVIQSPIKYSDYETIYIEKTNTPFNGHNGVVIYFDLIEKPASLFIKDTLKFTVEKGAKVSYTKDFFDNYIHWSSGMDTVDLPDRFYFIDESTNNQQTMNSSHWSLGKGKYKIKMSVAVCRPGDLMWDSVSVIVDETPCHHIEIKNQPSVCFEEVFDITPYVFIDGNVATAAQLEDMTFWDRSNVFNQSSGQSLDPASMNMGDMLNQTDHYPNMEVAYQPNTDLGVCTNYFYKTSTKVPAKFINTDILFVKDNAGVNQIFQIDGDYYGFDNSFNTDILNKLYLDYFDVLDGTEFKFYADYATSKVEETSATLSAGQYTAVAVNPSCAYDSTFFDITIKNRDFDIIWQSAKAYGKGYYTFTAPTYSGATYAWFIWGGSIISGGTTEQVLVYFSENASPAVTLSCKITLPNTRIANGGTLSSAIYFDNQNETNLEETIITNTLNSTRTESSAFPNPTSSDFAISGNGQYNLKIYNALGELVHINDSYTANTPMSITNKGIHIIHLTQNGKTQFVKIVVQ